ncbi:MAG: hypothetical protein ABWY94_07235, partial [Pseudoxanthomonas sp.]
NLEAASVVASANKQMVVLTIPQEPGVLYTLEARKRTGAYEANLAGDAVIIHRVVNQGMAYSIDAASPPANISNNEGSMFKAGETWVSPFNAFWVTVQSETATGFIVSVGPQPRYTGGPAPTRREPAAGAIGASLPASRAISIPISIPRARPPSPCAQGRGGLATRWRCDRPLQ